MHRRTVLRAGLAATLTAAAPAWTRARAGADGPDPAPDAGPVLLEAFVSQGCDLCPKAEALLGTLLAEFGPERLAAVAFHVDYFNDPWRDPFSDPLFSRRQWQYSTLYDQAQALRKPDVLYLTPLFLFNGASPMVASNPDAPDRARAAIRAALARPRPLRLEPTLAPDPKDHRRASLAVRVRPPADRRRGDRPPLIGAVLVEDGLETAVRTGELAGHTYRARQVARRLNVQPARIGADSPALTFPLALDPGWDPARCRVVLLAQDEPTGRIAAAAQLPWPGG